ncbi:MAG TPA: maleylpyruvate isomerase family mycothiol-dependent enzyme [Acidimicrobiales bacterium]|nr:maleylpyruvate isomerase family mycothiol-dependent enzyme [Acidimicrobiales bacterium]
MDAADTDDTAETSAAAATDDTSETTAAALAEQQEALTDLLVALDAADWAHPSRCEGWSVADVVLHLAQTDEMALASVEGRFAEEVDGLTAGLGQAADVDEGADLMVARERGGPPAAILERWRSGAAALRRALDAVDPHTRVTWVAGELSARTLATTRLAETWIHGDDIALPLGRPLPPGDRLRHVARLAWRTLPYAFARAGRTLAGPVAFSLRGPGGEPWELAPEGGTDPATVVRGDGVELCLVAARRVEPADTGLVAEGRDGAAVLELVRTYA